MRKIEALSDSEHLLLRPNMYVGSVENMQERMIIFDPVKNIMIHKNKIFSEGFYRILDEVIDNSFDEAKRCKEEGINFDKIRIEIDTKTNKATVLDDGRGFINGSALNPKTNISNIETAVTKLRAGSNFSNSEYRASLAGMNGIGVSATNMLSDYFEIETQSEQELYIQKWEKFICSDKKISEPISGDTYTKISFIPRKSTFKQSAWDFEILYTKLLLRQFQINNDSKLEGINIEFIFDGDEINLNIDIIPPDSITVNLNKRLKLFLWEATQEDMAKLSFVNSSQCIGLHQTSIEDYINDKIFQKDNAHLFYRSLILINLRPKDVEFREQNKSRLVMTKNKMEQVLPLKLSTMEINKIKATAFYENTCTRIKEFEDKNSLSKIKKGKRNTFKISDKYFSSKESKNLMICEGLSALGGLNQKRNPMTDSIYALKGKIKNVRTVQDLANSAVILDLINILGLKVEDKGDSCKFEKIIIAADYDVDGSHISALLINFFYRWFPKTILNGKLFILQTPLSTYILDKKINYVYSTSDLENIPKEAKDVRYLKGLGSLSIKDWEYVFSDMLLYRIIPDKQSQKYLDIGFSEDANKRKKWLLSKIG